MYFYEEDNNIISKYTFSNFITNEDEDQVYIAVKDLVKNYKKSTQFNPLFIVGKSGTGKSHMLNALAFDIRKKCDDVKFLYTTIDMLYKDILESFKNKEIEKLKSFYNNLDFLLIDDFNQIIGKKETQKIFFSIFNNLYSNGKKIIIASNLSIPELEKFNREHTEGEDIAQHIDDRIISRIMCGLSLEMRHYDYEMILAILRKKTEKLSLSDDILQYIATNVNTTNIKKIDSIIPQMMIYTVTTKKDISIEVVKEIIVKMNINKTNYDQISIDKVVKVTAKFFNVDEKKILGSSRRKEVALARHIAMYLATEYTELGQESIGEYFGGKNHSSIIYARNNIKKKLKTDENYNYYVKNIISSLKTH